MLGASSCRYHRALPSPGLALPGVSLFRIECCGEFPKSAKAMCTVGKTLRRFFLPVQVVIVIRHCFLPPSVVDYAGMVVVFCFCFGACPSAHSRNTNAENCSSSRVLSSCPLRPLSLGIFSFRQKVLVTVHFFVVAYNNDPVRSGVDTTQTLLAEATLGCE